MSEENKDPPAVAVEPEPVAPSVAEAAPVSQSAAPEAEPVAADEPKIKPSESDDDEVALDAAGRERPRFLLGFPQHPELARLSAAFEAGNYALVRADAQALAERAESPAVRDAALELRRRIEPDPLAKYLLALTAALLLSLAYWAYHH